MYKSNTFDYCYADDTCIKKPDKDKIKDYIR